MASRVGLIVRTTTARERSTAALVHIFAENDLGSVEAQAPLDRDADVAAMLREEWLADVLEALAFGTPADPETEDPDAEDHVFANPGFVDMSREDLEEVAVAWYQIDPEQYPDDMALRQALVAAYEADTGDGETDQVEGEGDEALVDEPQDEYDFAAMKRAELDDIAPRFDVDPSAFNKVDDLRAALIAVASPAGEV